MGVGPVSMDWITKYFRPKPENSADASPTDEIGSDVPIRSAKQDRLRRSAFAARIAVVLKGPSVEEGRVFAIRGARGTGKSSLKNMIIEELRTDANVKWLDFNPWQWADGDAITKALFREMADRTTMETFFDIDAIEGRIGSINRSALSQEQLHALDVLSRHLAKWRIASSRPDAASE